MRGEVQLRMIGEEWVDDHERVRVEMLDIDHRRLNRMLWRHHPLLALRLAAISRLSFERFWLPLASSLGVCMGYGASVSVDHRALDQPRTRAA